MDDPKGQAPELPPTTTKRWSPRRKAAVIEGIKAGVLSICDACERYDLSLEEVLSWQEAYERGGTKALRSSYQSCWICSPDAPGLT